MSKTADWMRHKTRTITHVPHIDHRLYQRQHRNRKPARHHPHHKRRPTAQVTIETYLVGHRQLGLRFVYLSGAADDPANKGYKVYYKVIAQGETPPANLEELSKSFFTKRKKEVIDFKFGDSGKTAYFAVQIENEGKKGPWGPVGKCPYGIKAFTTWSLRSKLQRNPL